MINFCYYPFLDGAQRDIDIIDEQTILYARDHIDKYTPTKLEDIDISVWLVSTIMLHNLKNNFLIKKFVTNYGKLFESHFSTDITKSKETRMAVLYHLDVLNNKDVSYVDKHAIKLHMNNYLEIALNVSDQHPQFLLINSNLDKGFVTIEIKKFAYLVRLVIEQKLYDKIKNGMEDYFEDETINGCVKELSEKYPAEEPKKKYINFSSTGTPTIIKQLIDKAYREHHLTHPERIKLGIYLQGQNYDEEYIMDIFKSLSDYNEKTTKYQLKSLRRYIK